MTWTGVWLIGDSHPLHLASFCVMLTQHSGLSLISITPDPSVFMGQTSGSSHDRKWGANLRKGLIFLALQLAKRWRLQLKRGPSCLLTGLVASYGKIPSVLVDKYKRQVCFYNKSLVFRLNGPCMPFIATHDKNDLFILGAASRPQPPVFLMAE